MTARSWLSGAGLVSGWLCHALLDCPRFVPLKPLLRLCKDSRSCPSPYFSGKFLMERQEDIQKASVLCSAAMSLSAKDYLNA